MANSIFQLVNERQLEVNGSFEIEQTMKTRRRYRNGIFPKYITKFEKKQNARLICVTPLPSIEDELLRFKRLFTAKEEVHLFERLHVFSAREFNTEVQQLVANDSFINIGRIWK